VAVKEIEAKTMLRKHKKIDSWFLSRYGMNFYRGCNHNCVYCDGRSEGYYVDGQFGEDVSVKTNAVEILQKELDPKRKRAPLQKGYIMLGGGVGDSYQPIEKTYQLSRKALHLLSHYDFPVHILTKSTLVKRDKDIIKKIDKKNKAIVSFSFSSTDDKISSIFEPGVPSPHERLEAIAYFKEEGISCGMFLLPVIPFVTDSPQIMERTIKKAKEVGIDFIIFGGMTLKDGRQKEYFLHTLMKNYPDLASNYQNIYRNNKWGSPIGSYSQSINLTFNTLAKKYGLPRRIPLHFYQDIISKNDLVIVLLEHIDYLLKLEGGKSPFGYAAYSISQLKQPLSTMKENLHKIKGVGTTTERIILEILETGSSSYYKKLFS
jgi:DNA repair photolyase